MAEETRTFDNDTHITDLFDMRDQLRNALYDCQDGILPAIAAQLLKVDDRLAEVLGVAKPVEEDELDKLRTGRAARRARAS